jgi:hypothetical protein
MCNCTSGNLGIPGSLALLVARNDKFIFVMPGLVPGIHVFTIDVSKDMDGRDEARP